jgi:hypothetical protein
MANLHPFVRELIRKELFTGRFSFVEESTAFVDDPYWGGHHAALMSVSGGSQRKRVDKDSAQVLSEWLVNLLSSRM